MCIYCALGGLFVLSLEFSPLISEGYVQLYAPILLTPHGKGIFIIFIGTFGLGKDSEMTLNTISSGMICVGLCWIVYGVIEECLNPESN